MLELVLQFVTQTWSQYFLNKNWFDFYRTCGSNKSNYMVRMSIATLKKLFSNHIISKNRDIVWPAR